MKRIWWGLGLLATHVIVGAVVGVTVAGRVVASGFGQRAADSPAYRLGLLLEMRATGADSVAAGRDYGAAVKAQEATLGATTATVLRLVGSLQGVGAAGELRYREAAAHCAKLGWTPCDRQSLDEMRRAVEP